MGRVFALLCIAVSSVCRRQYLPRSICFAVFAAFASQYLQYICWVIVWSIPVLLAASLRCLQNGRPTSLSLKLQAGRGENTGIHRKRGKRRSSSISGSPASSYLFGNPIKPWLMLLLLILKLDWCFYIWFWSHQHCSEILWRMFLLDWSLHHYLSEQS